MKLKSFIIKTVLLTCYASFFSVMASEEVQLAQDGKALLKISIPADASSEISSSAKRLSQILHGITGAPFEIVENEAQGIILGLRKEHSEILSEPPQKKVPTWQERYRLLSEKGNLYIIGETERAVSHAVSDFLYQLGYRHFLPTKTWEIIPSHPDLSIDIDKIEEPGFATRVLFLPTSRDNNLNRASRWNSRVSEFGAWRRNNHAFSAFNIRTGHAWVAMIKRNADAFEANPQWLVPGGDDWRSPNASKNIKFNLEHKELRELLCRDSVQFLKDNPTADTVSIDPSDASNWPKDSPLGSPSDQMVVLANDVIKAVQAEFPDKKVAFYAYHMHSPPPTRELEPGVIVNVATGFIRGGYTIEELMSGWREKGAELGIREYVNVTGGSWDLPGSSYIGFSPKKTYDRIRKFYEDGARYWIAETNTAWGAVGLGAYTAMRTLWDPVNGETPEEIMQDFLEKSFGPAKDAMKVYYEIIAPENHPLVSEDLSARMYDALHNALQNELTTEQKTRVLHLIAYTRFTELMHRFLNADEGENKQEAYQALARWVYDCREFGIMESRTYLSSRIAKGEALEAIAAAVMESDVNEPSEEDLIALLKDRRENAKRIGFTPKTWSEKLIPAGLNNHSAAEGANFHFSRRQTLIWRAEKNNSVFNLEIRGLGNRSQPLRPIEITLQQVDDPTGDSALSIEIIPDEQWHKADLKAPLAGLYYVTILTHGGYLEMRWPDDTSVVIPSGQILNSQLYGEWSGRFYVPAGVDRIGGYSERAKGQLLNHKGEILYDFSEDSSPGYFDIKITPVDKPRVFQFQNAEGQKILMTVPPYLSRNPSELLIPEDAKP